MDDDAVLRDSWRDACAGVAAEVDSRWLRRLMDQYREPTRAYHTLSHVRAILDMLQTVDRAPDDWRAVVFAAWFHDCVYDGKRADNEERSAEQWREFAQEAALPSELTAKASTASVTARRHALTCIAVVAGA